MLRDYPFATTVPSVDLERARRFYEGTLGLRVVDMTETGLQLEAGRGSQLFVYYREQPPVGDRTALSWLVDDIQAAVRDLRQRGIQLEQYDLPGLKTDENGIADSGDGLSAWFKDPDGNILAVTQLTNR